MIADSEKGGLSFILIQSFSFLSPDMYIVRQKLTWIFQHLKTDRTTVVQAAIVNLWLVSWGEPIIEVCSRKAVPSKKNSATALSDQFWEKKAFVQVYVTEMQEKDPY